MKLISNMMKCTQRARERRRRAAILVNVNAVNAHCHFCSRRGARATRRKGSEREARGGVERRTEEMREARAKAANEWASESIASRRARRAAPLMFSISISISGEKRRRALMKCSRRRRRRRRRGRHSVKSVNTSSKRATGQHRTACRDSRKKEYHLHTKINRNAMNILV